MHELVRIAQMQASFDDGQFPASWAPDLYRGWGSPIFVYYAPLFASTASVAIGILGSVRTGVLTTLLLFLILGAVGISMAAREVALWNPQANKTALGVAQRVALYLYILNPYLLADLYRRNAFAEFAALSIAPWILASLLAARRSPRVAVLGLLLSTSALLLTHNLTALILCALVLASIPLLYSSRSPQDVAARRVVAIGGGFGIALTAWFWWPAIALKSLVRSEELLTGKFRFAENFPPLGEALSWGNVWSIGPLILGVLATAVTFLVLHPRHPRWRLGLGFLLASIVYLWMMHPSSTLAWNTLPLLPLLQFPWRFLGPLALVCALLGALCVAVFCEGNLPRRGFQLEAAIAVLAILNVLPTLLAVRPLPPNVAETLDWALLPEVIREHGQSATVGDEYIPRQATSGRWREEPSAPIKVLQGQAQIKINHRLGSHLQASVLAAEASLLELSHWYFPGWRALVDDQRITPNIGPGASLTVRIPKGQHQLEVFYEAPPERRHGIAFSTLSMLLGLLFCASTLRRGNTPPDTVVHD